jgi:hypothetical protein
MIKLTKSEAKMIQKLEATVGAEIANSTRDLILATKKAKAA